MQSKCDSQSGRDMFTALVTNYVLLRRNLQYMLFHSPLPGQVDKALCNYPCHVTLIAVLQRCESTRK